MDGESYAEAGSGANRTGNALAEAGLVQNFLSADVVIISGTVFLAGVGPGVGASVRRISAVVFRGTVRQQRRAAIVALFRAVTRHHLVVGAARLSDQARATFGGRVVADEMRADTGVASQRTSLGQCHQAYAGNHLFET